MSSIYFQMLCPSFTKMILCHAWHQQDHLPAKIHFPLALLVYCQTLLCTCSQVTKACRGLSALAINRVFGHSHRWSKHIQKCQQCQPTSLHAYIRTPEVNKPSLCELNREELWFFHPFSAHKILQISLVLLEMVEFLTVKLDTAPTSSGLAGFTVNISSPSIHSNLALDKFSLSMNMPILFFSVSRYILKEHPVPRVFPRKVTLAARVEPWLKSSNVLHPQQSESKANYNRNGKQNAYLTHLASQRLEKTLGWDFSNPDKGVASCKVGGGRVFCQEFSQRGAAPQWSSPNTCPCNWNEHQICFELC